MSIFTSGINRLLSALTLVTGMAIPATSFGQYCLPTYNNPCTTDDYINSVQFVTINNSNTACGSPGVSNYTNYSGTIGTTVQAGATNTITVSPGPTWGQYFVAMIDINQDQDFLDAGEFFDIGYAQGGGLVSAPITVPCGAMAGTTRMRIMCRYANTPLTAADICATGLSFGEVEDYALTITMPSFTDAGIAGFTAPVTACGLGASNAVTVSVYNCGGTTITTGQLCYTFQGGPAVCENVNLNLAPGQTVNHTFATTVNMTAFGNYTFTATVTVPSDAVPGNNAMNNYAVTNIPVISTLPYSQNFDANDGGFTVEGTNPSWQWGTPSNVFIPSAASPARAWVTGLDTTYNASELSYLVSPCFNFSTLTADPFISFSHIYELPGWGDQGWLEVTTNAGGSWSKVGTASSGGNNWYDDPFQDTWSQTSGNPGAWRTADHRLVGTAGSSSVRFRFVMESESFLETEGFGLDNVRLRDTIFNAGVVSVNSPLNGCTLGNSETVSISVANFGTHAINNFPVCYILNGGAPVCQNITTPIPAGDTVNFTFSVGANVSAIGPHTVAAYSALGRDSIMDNDSASFSLVNYPVIAAPYFQDFEAGPALWTSGGTNNDWAFGTPAKALISGAASGSNAWVTGTLGFFNYQSDQDSWVESPCFDLSALTNPWVGTKIWWETEDNWDAALLEYSTNGGNTWFQIGQTGDPYNWYNDSTFIALTNAGLEGDGWGGRAVNTTGSGAYVQSKHEIAALTGATSVRFRIHFLSDGSVEYDGIAFDDFVIGDPPVVNLGNDTIVCSSLVLAPSLPTNGDFDWSNSVSTPTNTITSTGNYTLIYTDSVGLSGMDVIHVEINPTPQVSLGADFNICAGSSACIAIDSVAYPISSWSTGSTLGQICVSASGTWSVQVTDTVGCTSSDTIASTIVPLPNPQLGADTVLCFGQTLCLDPGTTGSGLSYIWSNGATTPTICTGIIAGYWVSVTDANGCSKSDSIIVTQGPNAPVAGFQADTSACPVVSFQSFAGGQVVSYAWDFGNGSIGSGLNTTHDYTASGNGTYNVQHFVANECGADTAVVTITISCLVSIDGGDGATLSIWPNPNAGRFHLETTLNGTAPAQVEVTDLRGQVVYFRDLGQQSGQFHEEIQLDAKATGVYLVRFQVGDRVSVEKVIVQ